MADGKFISYLRVSTTKQGASGLGLDAQRKAVADYLNGGRWDHVREFVEVESGKRADRPQLRDALALCRLHGATLLVAKLDRLSRNAAFLFNLRDAGVKFIAADMPEANELTVGIMAVVAEGERKAISKRTTEALAAAKERGTKLGGTKWAHLAGDAADKGRAAGNVTKKERASARAADLAPIISELRAGGAVSLRQLADGLNAKGLPTARGGSWSAVQVQRVVAALG